MKIRKKWECKNKFLNDKWKKYKINIQDSMAILLSMIKDKNKHKTDINNLMNFNKELYKIIRIKYYHLNSKNYLFKENNNIKMKKISEIKQWL